MRCYVVTCLVYLSLVIPKNKMIEHWRMEVFNFRTSFITFSMYLCYQFHILRNLRIDIKDILEEYSQSIVLDIHVELKVN